MVRTGSTGFVLLAVALAAVAIDCVLVRVAPELFREKIETMAKELDVAAAHTADYGKAGRMMTSNNGQLPHVRTFTSPCVLVTVCQTRSDSGWMKRRRS